MLSDLNARTKPPPLDFITGESTDYFIIIPINEMNFHLLSRYVYNPDKKMRKKGEFFSTVHESGTRRWPWKIRDIHDWDSPNGVKFLDSGKNMAKYPDEQTGFTEGKL